MLRSLGDGLCILFSPLNSDFIKSNRNLHSVISDRDIVMAAGVAVAAVCTPEVCDVTSRRDIKAHDVTSRSV